MASAIKIEKAAARKRAVILKEEETSCRYIARDDWKELRMERDLH